MDATITTEPATPHFTQSDEIISIDTQTRHWRFTFALVVPSSRIRAICNGAQTTIERCEEAH